MGYYGVWDKQLVDLQRQHLLSKLTSLTSVFSAPNLPQRAFPEGFHGTQIPVDADTVIQLIEHKLDRLDMVRDE
jgi:hypothetical protein